MIHMLQVVRTLVSPSNNTQVATACQTTVQQCGLLSKLCDTLMASGIPADILTETINALSETIRGHAENQTIFTHVTAPSSPPRSALILLLMAMVNEKQPFALRCAVLYCFQSYLHKNPSGQREVMNTLSISATEQDQESAGETVTAGQLLCGGLFSGDKLSNWFSAVGVAHGLMDQEEIKQDLLRVQLSTSTANTPVSLMQQVMAVVIKTGQVQTRLGLLMLISAWVNDCPPAVAQFLSDPAVLQYLTGQIGSNEHDETERLSQGLCAFLLGQCLLYNDNSVQGSTQEQLLALIEKRIGAEMFLDKLGEVSRHEGYNKALKQPQLKCGDSSELIFDHKFCQNFKVLEHGVLSAVNNSKKEAKSGDQECTPEVLAQYKEFIRQQDTRINEVYQANMYLQQELQKSQAEIEEQNQRISNLLDQNQLLKAQTSTTSNASAEIGLRDAKIQQLESQLVQAQSSSSTQANAEIALRDAKIQQLESQLMNGHATPSEQVGKSEAATEQQQHLASSHELELVQKQVSALQVSLSEKDLKLEKSDKSYKSLQESYEGLKDEQEDLLIMLTDQEEKVKKYKKICKDLGHQGEMSDSSSSDNEDVGNDE